MTSNILYYHVNYQNNIQMHNYTITVANVKPVLRSKGEPGAAHHTLNILKDYCLRSDDKSLDNTYVHVPVEAIAKEIFQGYENKMPKICKLWDWVKTKCGIQTERLQIKKLYQSIVQNLNEFQ